MMQYIIAYSTMQNPHSKQNAYSLTWWAQVCSSHIRLIGIDCYCIPYTLDVLACNKSIYVRNGEYCPLQRHAGKFSSKPSGEKPEHKGPSRYKDAVSHHIRILIIKDGLTTCLSPYYGNAFTRKDDRCIPTVFADHPCWNHRAFSLWICGFTQISNATRWIPGNSSSVKWKTSKSFHYFKFHKTKLPYILTV